MKYLLDTHVLLWAFSDKNKLSDTVTNILENKHNEIFVSALSLWELSLKFSISKLQIKNSTPDYLPQFAKDAGFKLISLSPNDASSYHRLPVTNHKDPFDRMLIWQAIQQDMILISTDNKVEQYIAFGLKTIW